MSLHFKTAILAASIATIITLALELTLQGVM